MIPALQCGPNSYGRSQPCYLCDSYSASTISQARLTLNASTPISARMLPFQYNGFLVHLRLQSFFWILAVLKNVFRWRRRIAPGVDGPLANAGAPGSKRARPFPPFSGQTPPAWQHPATAACPPLSCDSTSGDHASNPLHHKFSQMRSYSSLLCICRQSALDSCQFAWAVVRLQNCIQSFDSGTTL